jgi:hypothetical protein
MRQLLGVARYEFRMQRRSAVLWLVASGRWEGRRHGGAGA